MVDDVVTALTRFRWFRVVARQSSFAFRELPSDVREIAGHIWADRYERDLDDIFAIQDDIADSLVGAIEPELLKDRITPECRAPT